MSKIIKVYKMAKTLDNTRVSVYNEIKKYNPYHGPDGRFASANGMKAGGSFALPKNSKNLKNATIPEGVRVFSGQGAKGKRAVTTSIGTTIENGKITGGAPKSGEAENKKPQSLTEKYPLDTSKKVSSPDEYFDMITKDIDWDDTGSFLTIDDKINAPLNRNANTTRMVLENLGYMGKPTKVSKEEFEEFVKKSPYGEIQRGFSSGQGEKQANQYMKDFTDGDATPNLSGYAAVYGQGFYFAYGDGKEGVASSYANMGRKGTGPTLKAVLHPDAKVLKFDDSDHRSYSAKMKKPYTVAARREISVKEKFEKTITKETNRSTYAALKGYDAVEVGDREYLVILNRSAVIIQE